ncbi:hypothetical protein GCM10027051_23320 [Niabella terrae]
MVTSIDSYLVVDTVILPSRYLKREVELQCFLPKNVTDLSNMSLLLINDGQDMGIMQFGNILNQRYAAGAIHPVLCVAIAAGPDRLQEYGISGKKDYLGRGSRARQYSQFITKELLGFISKTYRVPVFRETAFAGFSLGGLSALDIVWQHPRIFSRAGVFSGSLWWRSLDQSDPRYDDNKHRIMQQQIRKGKFRPGLQFFFQCGKLDESGDRNNNGIIDAIDDTLDLMQDLVAKGYRREDLFYLELEEGRHDIASWGQAMPAFLEWAWGK